MAALFLLPLLLLSLAANHQAVLAAVRLQSPPGKLIAMDLQHLGGEEATLAMRVDDVSLAGFANRSRHWHAFRGSEDLLPATTPLSFGNSYRDLIGGVENLPGVPIRHASEVQASRLLSFYDPATATAADEEALKRALAALTVMFREAQWLSPITDIVMGGWGAEAHVAPEHLPYIEHWESMFYELKRWKRSGKWSGPFTEVLRKEAKINSAEEALAVVGWTIRQMVLGHGPDDTCRSAVRMVGSSQLFSEF